MHLLYYWHGFQLTPVRCRNPAKQSNYSGQLQRRQIPRITNQNLLPTQKAKYKNRIHVQLTVRLNSFLFNLQNRLMIEELIQY